MKPPTQEEAWEEFAKNSEPNAFFGGRLAKVSARGQPPRYIQVLGNAGTIVSVSVRHCGQVQTYWVAL